MKNKKTIHLTPADWVIRIFKGVRATSRALKKSPAAIVRWRKPLLQRGTGGEIPSSCYHPILTLARAKDLDITPNDLVFGRDVKRK